MKVNLGEHDEIDEMENILGVADLGLEFEQAGLNFERFQMIDEPFCFSPDRLFADTIWTAEDRETYLSYAESCITSMTPSGNKPTYLDRHRRNFFDTAILTVFNMETRDFGGNSHHVLAHGPKGTGTSTFLKGFVKTVQLIGVRVVGIYHDVGATIQVHLQHKTLLDNIALDLPSQIIVKALEIMGFSFPVEFDATSLNSLSFWLKQNRMRVVFVVDEYHAAYTTGSAAVFRTQIYHMINDVNGGYFVTVAGSSAYLRGLCYGKLSEGMEQFPSYVPTAGNLNSQRTTLVRFDSLRGKDEFDQYLTAQYPHLLVVSTYGRSSREQFLESIFLATGGNRRAIEQVSRQLGSRNNCFMGYYSEVLKVIAGKYKPLWFLMVVTLRKHRKMLLQPNELSSTSFTVFDMLDWVKVSDLRQVRNNLSAFSGGLMVPADMQDAISQLTCLNEDSLCALYRASDEDGIVLDDSDSQPKVRFVYPSQFLYVADRAGPCTKPFTPYLQIFLR